LGLGRGNRLLHQVNLAGVASQFCRGHHLDDRAADWELLEYQSQPLDLPRLFQHQAVLGWIKARLAKDTLEGPEAKVVEFA